MKKIKFYHKKINMNYQIVLGIGGLLILLNLVKNNNKLNLREKWKNCNIRLMPNEKIWNSKSNVKYNNCYAYAFRDLDANRKKKPQPGYKNNMKQISKTQYNCKEFIKRIKLDYPNIEYKGKNKPDCDTCGRSIFLAIDDEGKYDYHFWRESSDGSWTHKPGSLKVSKVDASGKKIYDPSKSNRNFKNYNYKKSCGFFCVYDADKELNDFISENIN